MNTGCRSLELIPRYKASSSWWEHVPTAHWLVEKLKPNKIVELGSHYGVSFFSFCEAASQYSNNTFIYAVDTWRGDEQAGYYGDKVYDTVKQHQEEYHIQRSALLRCTFREASMYFSERSIDMIHIDGLHTYEAVKEDYDTWNPKLKEEGTLLFHDCNVRERNFGVWKLWEEIKESGEYHCIEIPNGYGLGLATRAKEKPQWHTQLELELNALNAKGRLLMEQQVLREKLSKLESENDELKKHAVNLEKIREENEKHIKSLMHSKKDKILNLMTGKINRLKASIKNASQN